MLRLASWNNLQIRAFCSMWLEYSNKMVGNLKWKEKEKISNFLRAFLPEISVDCWNVFHQARFCCSLGGFFGLVVPPLLKRERERESKFDVNLDESKWHPHCQHTIPSSSFQWMQRVHFWKCCKTQFHPRGNVTSHWRYWWSFHEISPSKEAWTLSLPLPQANSLQLFCAL